MTLTSNSAICANYHNFTLWLFNSSYKALYITYIHLDFLIYLPKERVKTNSILYSRTKTSHSLRIMCIWGVIIYSAGICECWPTYQWTNASASVCNEAVLCYKTFPCSKYFLFYSITDIFDNKINNLALWYINFIAQHFSVRLRTSGMWAIAIVKNNNHKSMQHYCINFEVV